MADIAWQVDRYIELGYPELAGIDEQAFRALAAPLVAAARDIAETGTAPNDAPGTSRVTVTLVVTRLLVDPEVRVPRLHLHGSAKSGILDRNHFSDARTGLAPYEPRHELAVPPDPMYLLLDFERGDQHRDVAPRDARASIAARGRTPLTIDEGLSVASLVPDVLVANHCFMLDGSTRGDKRVPALWISARAPKLGWCFDGVPHSWLGVASADARVAVAPAAPAAPRAPGAPAAPAGSGAR